MKRLIILIGLMLMLLVACGDDDMSTEHIKEPVEETSTEQNTDEPTQEELNEQMKEEAIEADFVEVNTNEPEEGTRLYAEGEVTALADVGVLQEFTLTTDEPDGNRGMYNIVSLSDTEVSEGDQVKVYGSYTGKDETGVPTLSVAVIE